MTCEPMYYKNFKCIANKCKDNCCIGWEIDIDDDTYKKYMDTKGDFGKKLKDNIYNIDNLHCFKLDKNERCMFLNKNNLCEIILNMGEENLCEICQKHPRYINRHNGLKEYGLGLACEEACRIILTEEQPIFMVNSDTNQKYDTNPFTETDLYMAYIFEVRKVILSILQNRNYSINKRLIAVIKFCTYVKEECFSEKTDSQLFSESKHLIKISDNLLNNYTEKVDKTFSFKNTIIEIVNSYLQNEFLCESWKSQLEEILIYIKITNENELEDNYKNFINSNYNNIHFENFLVYLTLRYFLECYYNDSILEKIQFMFSAYTIINIILQHKFYIHKNYEINDIIETAHNFSKEIEYSDINIEKLENCFHNISEYPINNILNFLASIN